MKKLIALCLVCLVAFPLFAVSLSAEEVSLDLSKLDTPISYYQTLKKENIVLNVYNWGEYISDGQDGTMNVNKEFEKLTGIQVNYTNYPANEDMYAKMKSGATSYDIVIPSDYMVSRMMEEKMIQKLDFSKIPNFSLIMEDMKNPEYDPTNEYSVPYTWGTVGLIYNTKYVDEFDVKSWAVLWDEKYAGKILMFRNSRDAFAIAQKRLGFSLNSTNIEEYEEAAELLKKQCSVVDMHVMDEVFDKMIGEEHYLAPYYAGDAITMIEDNENLAFSVPSEGTNRFADAICIPAGSKNVQAAHIYINFLNETQVALANAEYICYPTPHQGAYDLLDEETKSNPIAYPPEHVLENTETFVHLPNEVNQKMDQLWEAVLMETANPQEEQQWTFPLTMGLLVVASVAFFITKAIRKRKSEEF